MFLFCRVYVLCFVDSSWLPVCDNYPHFCSCAIVVILSCQILPDLIDISECVFTVYMNFNFVQSFQFESGVVMYDDTETRYIHTDLVKAVPYEHTKFLTDLVWVHREVHLLIFFRIWFSPSGPFRINLVYIR